MKTRKMIGERHELRLDASSSQNSRYLAQPTTSRFPNLGGRCRPLLAILWQWNISVPSHLQRDLYRMTTLLGHELIVCRPMSMNVFFCMDGGVFELQRGSAIFVGPMLIFNDVFPISGRDLCWFM